MLRLSDFKDVKNNIDKFRKKYPDWQRQVDRMLPELGRRQKKKSPGIKLKKKEKLREKNKKLREKLSNKKKQEEDDSNMSKSSINKRK